MSVAATGTGPRARREQEEENRGQAAHDGREHGRGAAHAAMGFTALHHTAICRTRHSSYHSAMPSTLGYALLGLLAREPRTGYELAQALRIPVGYFWSASHSQIYPELARLEADAFVHSRVVPGPGPRDTKRYTISAAGRRALAAWVVMPAELEEARSEELLKTYSLWLADPAAAREMVSGLRDRHREMLSRYERIAAEIEHDGPLEPATPRFFDYATLRRGLSFERHAIAWCDWLLGALG
jgi:DNA-binding PadR family transcriptional regulator